MGGGCGSGGWWFNSWLLNPHFYSFYISQVFLSLNQICFFVHCLPFWCPCSSWHPNLLLLDLQLCLEVWHYDEMAISQVPIKEAASSCEGYGALVFSLPAFLCISVRSGLCCCVWELCSFIFIQYLETDFFPWIFMYYISDVILSRKTFFSKTKELLQYVINTSQDQHYTLFYSVPDPTRSVHHDSNV